MPRSIGIAALLALGGLTAASASDRVYDGNAQRGQAIYESRCVACHSVDEDQVGPHHRGVLGRKAGSVPGYDYSDALRHSHIVWTRRTLMAWLSDPEALIPGQKMGYRVEQAQDRADVVAYLATLK